MRKSDSLRKNTKREHKKTHNVWRSYSDMMSGLLLLFILVMAVSFIESQRSYEAELQSQEVQERLSEEVKKQQEEVEIQRAQLEEQQKTMEEQQKTMEEQRKALKEQTEIVENQKKVMSEQQAKIDKIIGVKADLISDLKKEFEKNNLSVSIDEETGAITFDSNILFAYNESVLTNEGREMLQQMLPIYCQILLQDQYVSYLSEIMIDGFTDTVGNYEYNLKLSQSRAYAVAEFLLSIKDKFLNEDKAKALEDRMSVNGRSKSNPILTADNQIDMDASRRVEVKFRLKDDEMITELQKIMDETGAS